MTGLPCPICGDPRSEAVLVAKGLKPKDPRFYVRRCFRCGLGWTEPKIPDSQIGRWYPLSYYGKGNVRFNLLFEILVRCFRKRRARVIAKRTSPGAVLDVGCGRGITLGYLKSMGYQPYGIEITEEGAWHAKNRLALPVYVGALTQAPLHAGQFDIVIFWHSLEHMSDPIRMLHHARKLLKPGGLLVIAVPNQDSFQAKIFGSNWFHLDIPRHYFHFGKRCLKMLLRDLEFQIVQTDHFNFEQNPYGWLQSFYNAMGLPFNFLYFFLKDHKSYISIIKKHPVQAAVTLALLPILFPLSLAMTLVETILRRGGTIELYAIKK